MNNFQGKKCLVMGAGKSGLAAAEVLKNCGADVVVCDAGKINEHSECIMALSKVGVRFYPNTSSVNLLDGIDVLLLSPGVSVYHEMVEKAKKNNVQVLGEIELSWVMTSLPVVAVTGTNGKTTTTTWVGDMFTRAGKYTIVGGNIGNPLSKAVVEHKQAESIVAEISSFQMESVIDFAPHVAAVLNITPDHLDRHRTMEEYIEMKKKVFAKQKAEDFAVLNYDDETVRMFAKDVVAKVCFFSSKEVLAEGIFLDKDGSIVIKYFNQTHQLCHKKELKLFGDHNVENALAAIACAFLSGINLEYIKQSLLDFAGVEHRIEKVAVVNGITFYNDSKATNPESTVKAIEAFSGNLILLLGGRDKKTDLNELFSKAKVKTKQILLFGEAATRFADNLQKMDMDNFVICRNMAEAFEKAVQCASDGDVVLLSPACASFDEFKNYEERGSVFKQLVHQYEC